MMCGKYEHENKEDYKNRKVGIFKRKKIIFIMTILSIVIAGSLWIIKAYIYDSKEVFNQFGVNKDLALTRYNQLPNISEERVDKFIKDDLDNKYKSEEDNTTMQKTIDLYDGIGSLKDYLKQMRDKSYFRMIYSNLEDSISKKGGLEKMDKFELEKLIKDYSEIDTISEYHDDSQNKIRLIEKELPRAEEEYVKEFKGKYGIDITPKVKKKEPQIGMTKSEVLASSWGKSKDINKTTTKYGTDEQWVYSGNRYLYFKDGILTTIQE